MHWRAAIKHIVAARRLLTDTVDKLPRHLVLRNKGIGRDANRNHCYADRRIGTIGLAVVAPCAFSLGIAGQVLRFRTRAWLSFAPPTCPMPSRQHSGPPPDSSRSKGHPPVSTSPNPLSTRQRRFACARLSQPCLPGSSSRLFRNPHHHGF